MMNFIEGMKVKLNSNVNKDAVFVIKKIRKPFYFVTPFKGFKEIMAHESELMLA